MCDFHFCHCGCCSVAPLSVKHKIGEILLLGFNIEVVVSNAVPLVVEKADDGDDEAHRQADSETGDSNYLKSIVVFIQVLCKNMSADIRISALAVKTNKQTNKTKNYLKMELRVTLNKKTSDWNDATFSADC